MNLRLISVLTLVFVGVLCNATPNRKNETSQQDARQQQNSSNRNSGASAQHCNSALVAKYKYTNYSQSYSYNRPATYQYNTAPVGSCGNCNQQQNRR